MFSPEFIRDAGERIAVTFLQAFLAVVVASGADWIDVSTWKTAGIAAVAAALSALKALIARKVGDPEAASLTK